MERDSDDDRDTAAWCDAASGSLETYWDRTFAAAKNAAEAGDAGPLADAPEDDWVADPEDVARHVRAVIADAFAHAEAPVRVLVVGCGTSRLSEMLHAFDAVDVTSTDISGVAVAAMQARCPDMRFVRADCTRLHEAFAAASFDVVVDKGVADTLLFRAAKPAREGLLRRYFAAVHHVTPPGGVFVAVSPREKIPGVNRPPISTCWRLAKVKIRSEDAEERLIVGGKRKPAVMHVFSKIPPAA